MKQELEPAVKLTLCRLRGLGREEKTIPGRSPGEGSISVNPTLLPGTKVSTWEGDGATGGNSRGCSNFVDIEGLCEGAVPGETCFSSSCSVPIPPNHQLPRVPASSLPVSSLLCSGKMKVRSPGWRLIVKLLFIIHCY